jgi:alpha-L-rhamnosidase
MNKTSFSHLLFFLLVLQVPFISFGSTTRVTNLRCEYLVNPLGIDVNSPRLSWQIRSEAINFKQTAYEIRVAESPSRLGKVKKLIWTSGNVISDQSVNVAYIGPKLEPKKRYYWQVRIWDSQKKVSNWSETAWWETGLTDPALWKAEWIAASGKGPDDHHPVSFRKDFTCGKSIRSARLYCSSLGLYQVFLNGRKVSPDLFMPGWTSFNKRTQYQTYEVTAMLQTDNAITALVGDGWYRGNIGGKVQQNYYGDRLALIAQLEIAYTDGTIQQIGTDTSWQAGNSAIIASDIYNGETVDAGWAKESWDRYGFKSSDFIPVEVLNHPKNILVAQRSNPVRAITELKPQKIIVTPSGETVFDMGQNMVGWVRLKVHGKKGDHVVLKFAEVLDHSGNFYTENLRKAKATDEFILKGGEQETFEPHFTFHGFRYVKLEKFPGTPDLNTVTGVVIHTDMEPTGSFECSDTLVNTLHHNIQWGQKGNFLDVPTDCPQRDERLGWTGDAQVFAPTAAFNFDVAPFFTKWVADLAADQLPDGKVTDVVPDVRSGRGSSTAWGDAAIVVPWTVYQAYGDTRILEDQYTSMKAWVEYMRKRAGDDHLWTGDTHYGDWLAFASSGSDYPGATTETDLIATAYYAFSTGRLARIASILGKSEDAHVYGDLAQKIKAAFCEEFLTPSGRLVSNTQTAYALALSFGLLPESMNAKAASYLAADVQKMEHLTTGFVGTPLLCQALSDYGYADQAFMLLMNREYPSWLYPVTQGATTIWERWDGLKPDGTFQDKSMNSFNHYAYGAIGNWLYNYVAGIRIDPLRPGYKHFFLQPHAGGGLTHASAELKTMYGVIRSAWSLGSGEMTYTCVIPENSSAAVCFDQVGAKNIQMNNQPLSKLEPMRVSDTNGKVKIEIGSGKYVFKFPFSVKK